MENPFSGFRSHIHVCVLSRFSRVQLFTTLWIVARQAPLSIGFSRQEYWNGLPFPSPEDLPDPGVKPTSLESLALTSRFFTTSTSWETPSSPICGFISDSLRIWNLEMASDGFYVSLDIKDANIFIFALRQAHSYMPRTWEFRLPRWH